MRRVLVVIAYGLAGILVTAGLTAAAFAIAGKDISQPARPLGIYDTATQEPAPTASETPKPRDTGDKQGGGKGDATGTPSVDDHGGATESPSVDDHGGATESPSGSDDSSSDSTSDASGSGDGSGDDNGGDD